MPTHNEVARQALRRAELFQQIASVRLELLELLPTFVSEMESIGLDPVEVIQKLIEKAKYAAVSGSHRSESWSKIK